MSMTAPKSEGSFEKHPEGQFPLVCVQVVDMGTHFNEKKEKYERKIRFMFLSDVLMKEGDNKGLPFAIFSQFNYSMYQNSHLYQFIQSWVGKQFPNQDVADHFGLEWCLGKGAYAQIAHNQGYVNIVSIMPLPVSMKIPAITTETVLFDLKEPNRDELAKLSDKTQEHIMKSKEWQYFVANEGKSYDERNPPPPKDEDITPVPDAPY